MLDEVKAAHGFMLRETDFFYSALMSLLSKINTHLAFLLRFITIYEDVKCAHRIKPSFQVPLVTKMDVENSK